MTHVYERGQLVIPKYLRELLKWDAGTEVVMRVENNRLVTERKTSVADELAQFASDAKVNLGSQTDFDSDYTTAMRRKYKKMGLDI